MLAKVAFAAALLFACEGAGMAQAPLCSAIMKLVEKTAAGDTVSPLFIPSYEPGDDEAGLPLPIAGSAFSYDNALAIMALVSCNEVHAAKRIGDAFLAAIASDRTFKDGRVRNAYRAGIVKPGPVPLPGWWDAEHNVWAEDAYQDGTQTGNVAWVGLALLALEQASGDGRYREAAKGLARWITNNTLEDRPPAGLTGGMAGFDASQTAIRWKSTEHNLDAYALGVWLVRNATDSSVHELVKATRSFLDAMFDPIQGGFRLGTLPDGRSQPPDMYALDALIWPLVGVSTPPTAWRRSLSIAKDHLAVSGGYDFNGDRDGLWTEGTAQVALVERALGNRREADRLLGVIDHLRAPSGLLYATGRGQISTGLSIGDTSKEADFFYFHRPHLGATAWAILAQRGLNPFTGERVD